MNLTFTEAQLQFADVLDLLRSHDQLPDSYAKVINALTVKLHTLAELERSMTNRRNGGQ